MNSLLEVRQLRRHYSVRANDGLFAKRTTLKAVDGVDLDIARGETLGLVGESGCGKSTTARLILGHIAPTSGTVSFSGQPIDALMNAHWRAQRRRMQMIYQDPLGALDRRWTIRRQIAEPFDIHEPTMPAEAVSAKVDTLLDAVGLRHELAERYPHELSGGQRQRAVIARALALEPELLVCDEPVSALDVSIQAQVLNLLDELRERTGFAALFISHDLKVVRQIADRVAVMYLGRIVESGRPDEIFHHPRHPYTQALVAAIPRPHGGRVRMKATLTGDPPDPVDVPGGCAFHPRCPVAKPHCRQVVPTKNSIRMSQGAAAQCQLFLASSFMRRADTRDGVRQRGEARQCALYWVNQPFSGSDIVWLARDVFAPRDSKRNRNVVAAAGDARSERSHDSSIRDVLSRSIAPHTVIAMAIAGR